MNPLVVVPVFNAAQAVDACLGSLLRTLARSDSVLIADDASTDPQIETILAAFARRAAFEVRVLRQPHNLGFVGNCNSAMREAGARDVVLLNSDTETTSGWLDRIAACARSDTRIASITPWSNNAEICTFPAICRVLPPPEDPELVARAALTAGTPQYPDLPTGVGFCMYIRRAALCAIGDFDQASFGRGYGEENDWCLRAIGHGWRNVLCDDAYVVHHGGASFGPLGLAPGGGALARLNARYPGYNEQIARFILDDPLRSRRDRIAERLDELASGWQPSLFPPSSHV
jgi:GT2 family glycosyltransferase